MIVDQYRESGLQDAYLGWQGPIREALSGAETFDSPPPGYEDTGNVVPQDRDTELAIYRGPNGEMVYVRRPTGSGNMDGPENSVADVMERMGLGFLVGRGG